MPYLSVWAVLALSFGYAVGWGAFVMLCGALVASYYTNWSHEHFVTEEMVAEIKQKIANVRYRHVWNREMPEKNTVESVETCN
ncbi:MAG: hypothetical protein II946_00880 [Kiritimatiellae bacterium]|nr:hypothetical protein [Kiritimatiellia bacterium]